MRLRARSAGAAVHFLQCFFWLSNSQVLWCCEHLSPQMCVCVVLSVSNLWSTGLFSFKGRSCFVSARGCGPCTICDKDVLTFQFIFCCFSSEFHILFSSLLEKPCQHHVLISIKYNQIYGTAARTKYESVVQPPYALCIIRLEWTFQPMFYTQTLICGQNPSAVWQLK